MTENGISTTAKDYADQTSSFFRRHLGLIARVLLLTHYIEIPLFALYKLPGDVAQGEWMLVFENRFFDVLCLPCVALIIHGKFGHVGCAGLMAYRFLTFILEGWTSGVLLSIVVFCGHVSSLVLLLVDWYISRERKAIGADLPNPDTKIDKFDMMILTARIALSCLYMWLVVAMLSIAHDAVWYIGSFFALVAVVMIFVGFHVKHAAMVSAISIIMILSATLTHLSYSYGLHMLQESFRIVVVVLSIVGGLLCLAHLGAGRLSLDAYKKRT